MPHYIKRHLRGRGNNSGTFVKWMCAAAFEWPRWSVVLTSRIDRADAFLAFGLCWCLDTSFSSVPRLLWRGWRVQPFKLLLVLYRPFQGSVLAAVGGGSL